MYDTPGLPAPDMTGCLIARELIDDWHLTCAEAAEVLTTRGYQCKSPNTARTWAIRGREEWKRVAQQDVTDAQTRRAQHLLRELARNYHAGANITVVEFVRESMRVERHVASLHGTDAPKRIEHSGQIGLPAVHGATGASVDAVFDAPPPSVP